MKSDSCLTQNKAITLQTFILNSRTYQAKPMTTVFREIPKHYWLMLFSSDEVVNHETTGCASTAKPLPSCLSELLEKLATDADCQFIGRVHSKDDPNCDQLEEFCESMPLTHHHVLLYFPQCTNAEKVIRQSVSQVLSNVQTAKIKLLTVSYPENFLTREATIYSNESLIVKGEKCRH